MNSEPRTPCREDEKPAENPRFLSRPPSSSLRTPLAEGGRPLSYSLPPGRGREYESSVRPAREAFSAADSHSLPREYEKEHEDSSSSRLVLPPAPRALLVTGARSLAKVPAARSWAQAALRQALDALDPRHDLVLAGGAAGPDRWCARLILDGEYASVRLVEYLPDGRRAVWHPAGWADDGRPLPHQPRHSRWADGDPGPLARNAAMVEGLLRARDRGYMVSVLALLDPASPTGGTRHTVQLAREAGLPVDERTWGGGA